MNILPTNPIADFNKPFRWGLLFPFTSKGYDSWEDAKKAYELFYTNNIPSTNIKGRHIPVIMLAIDLDDDMLVFHKDYLIQFAQENDCEIYVTEYQANPSNTPYPICKVWRELAKQAYLERECDFTVFLGDDVVITTKPERSSINSDLSPKPWMDYVHQGFQEIYERLKLDAKMFGFGCVALQDAKTPSFPTFPVLHKLHLELLEDEVFPTVFINQDADPFLFALYRRWGAAKILSNVKIENRKGGVQLPTDVDYTPPRYERVHVKRWKDDLLSKEVARLETCIATYCAGYSIAIIPNRKYVIDVITPSFRVDRTSLESILSLNQPDQADIHFLMIVDDPNKDITWLEQKAADDIKIFRLTVIKNLTNRGASETRNVGLDGADADYILFLDDDVYIDNNRDLINHYVVALQTHPEASGYVGPTILPKPFENSSFHHGFNLSGIGYFWDIALKQAESPWGITANLFIKRNKQIQLRFDQTFIKTGGGEDIDYCLQLESFPLICVPNASVEHPWWNKGKRCYDHFRGWGFGDSYLMIKYPHFTFVTMPNIIEVSAFIMLLASFRMITRLDIYCLLNGLYSLLAVWIVEVLMDTVEIDDNGLANHILLYTSVLKRFLVMFEKTLCKASTEIGHFLGPLSRGECLICHRFDWFCGTYSNYRPATQWRHFIRFLVYLVVLYITTARHR